MLINVNLLLIIGETVAMVESIQNHGIRVDSRSTDGSAYRVIYKVWIRLYTERYLKANTKCGST